LRWASRTFSKIVEMIQSSSNSPRPSIGYDSLPVPASPEAIAFRIPVSASMFLIRW
jgi:hypothetical protein